MNSGNTGVNSGEGCSSRPYDPYKGDFLDPKEHWHLKKEFTIGQITAILLLIGTVLAIWDDLDDRVALLDANEAFTQRTLNSHARLIKDQADFTKEVRGELKQEFGSLNAKIDKLIDRHLDRPYHDDHSGTPSRRGI